MVVYERHHADFEEEVQALEQQRASLVDSSMPLGLFNTLDVPDRAGPHVVATLGSVGLIW